MTFQEWLQTEAGRMVSFSPMPRMLEIVWNASAEAAEARIVALEKERDAFAEENDAIHRTVNELCGTDTSTIEAVALVVKERDELRAALEYYTELDLQRIEAESGSKFV